jgi:hypothetical protein
VLSVQLEKHERLLIEAKRQGDSKKILAEDKLCEEL